ncbi:hypothetical protein L7F22_003183 [Adiantum nelumboides]|nr:hypothetical protein [Adiantum nelumboides]
MLKPFFIILLTLVVLVQSHPNFKRASKSTKSTSGWDPSKNIYPNVQRGSVTFQYPSAKAKGKVTVADPFNWLEKETNSSDVQSFINQQRTLANSFLNQCKDQDSITKAIQQAGDYVFYAHFTQVGTPKNPSYIFAAQGQDPVIKWYYATPSEMENAKKQNFAEIPGKLLVDESTLSQDGSLYIDRWDVNDEKTYAAYTVSGGDAGIEIRFLDLKTFKSLPETIPYGGSMSFIFVPGGKGIVYDHQAYQKFSDPTPFNTQSKIFYHKIASDPKNDVLLVQADTKEITNLWDVEFTSDQKYMMLHGLTDATHYRVYVSPLDQQAFTTNMKWLSLQPKYGSAFQYLTNIETDFYFVTKHDGAKNSKVVHGKIDVSKARSVKDLNELSDTIKTQDIIPENKAGNLEGWSIIDKTKMVMIYLENAKYNFYINDIITGKRIQQLFSDFIGKYYRISDTYNGNQAFIELSSFNLGSGIYRISSENGKIAMEPFLIGNPSGIDMTQFKTEQHFATSKDGIKVPFDIFYSKKHPLDASKPVWLLGYGSFGQKTIPYYDSYMLPWVRDHGGASAYLQIRGGGELGDQWHKAGMLEQRHHSFEDFQAVAEYLVKNKMAASGNIIAEGTEGGGTVAMVMGNQAPEGLFGVLLPSVAILDMLRFDKYPYSDGYTAEWGSPQKPNDFDVLRAYSPLHNIDAKKTYPAILLSQSLDDGSSAPAHSFKMIAELQHSLPKNPNPLLLSVVEFSDKYSETSNSIKQCFVNQILGLKRV